jgi:hypothetical protein
MRLLKRSNWNLYGLTNRKNSFRVSEFRESLNFKVEARRRKFKWDQRVEWNEIFNNSVWLQFFGSHFTTRIKEWGAVNEI